ncbi:hypothetical protein MVLG_04755 [Microbotryum lychnidis-dioicae p1A1 Lamole]|uniref:EGF-like domain-containing protein n=1 Tax=Microbotryum lychnidis-dioicae (strain p1A1 Lamole / MvSl-1064) TaxID=683840 RepID=U5HC68_USTV1|nr:hypothetical protein MVLG_04755 [Microbotryum lychnidis-dioicae p1A1 Lamole]|eukprot:KDE04791.1 hypothetical protein MVLG_04755 [Microbotryum lychnidis-dioicae p1A1 Lamole]
MILRGYETVLLLLSSSISLGHAELTPVRLTPRRLSPATGAQGFARSLVERGTPSSFNSTNVTSAVCTATQCLQGTNSLSAGVYVVSRANGTNTTLVKLLPGTYTSSSSTNANSSLLSFPSSTSASTATPSAGFTSSGTLGSTYTVSLQPGIIAYSSILFQGTPTYLALPATNTSASNSTSTSLGSSISSLLLSNEVYAILHAGSERFVVWDGVADVSQWRSVVKNQVTFQQLQSSACATPCASGGTCTGDGRCACATGWAGTLCDICEPGHYGSSCLPCPANCANCDQGVTGSGRCLDVGSSSIVQPSTCNCINGICASNSSSATCACSAGWSTAANGTQCGACATGYYQTNGGDCLACDASCASCSSPSGTCLTCQSGLQPDSTDATKCITATSTSANGTFITCAARTYYDSTSQSCIDCNPLCETCYTTGTGGCLTCRSPNGLLNGQCVAVSTKTGVCNSAQETKYKANAVWVFDNTKHECDALPAKCSAGGIDNFSSGSLRSGVTCSTCVPGSYLYQGICYNPCPNGTAVSTDETSCVPCDSSCSTCYGRSNTVLSSGACVASTNSCQVIPGFGACLSQLVVVSVADSAPVSSKKKLPWWWILLSLLLTLFSLLGGFWWWRRKDKARRRKRTERFGLDLGHHEVKLKLQKLDPVIANPVVPKAEEEVDPVLMETVPLTPRRFDTSHYKSGKRDGEAHELEGIKVHDLKKELERTKEEASHHQNRWSNVSYRSVVHPTPSRPAPMPPLQPQDTGTSAYSDTSTFTTASGKKVRWGDRNPFNPHH